MRKRQVPLCRPSGLLSRSLGEGEGLRALRATTPPRTQGRPTTRTPLQELLKQLARLRTRVTAPRRRAPKATEGRVFWASKPHAPVQPCAHSAKSAKHLCENIRIAYAIYSSFMAGSNFCSTCAATSRPPLSGPADGFYRRPTIPAATSPYPSASPPRATPHSPARSASRSSRPSRSPPSRAVRA